MQARNWVARRDAKRSGETTYRNGLPCPAGHVDERYTTNGRCVVCSAEAAATIPREQKRRLLRRWRFASRAKARECERRYRAKKLGLPVPTRPMSEACECCGQKSERRLVIDHCHPTGVFRGWLCHRCNMGLGMLGDTRESIGRVLEYLTRAQ